MKVASFLLSESKIPFKESYIFQFNCHIITSTVRISVSTHFTTNQTWRSHTSIKYVANLVNHKADNIETTLSQNCTTYLSKWFVQPGDQLYFWGALRRCSMYVIMLSNTSQSFGSQINDSLDLSIVVLENMGLPSKMVVFVRRWNGLLGEDVRFGGKCFDWNGSDESESIQIHSFKSKIIGHIYFNWCVHMSKNLNFCFKFRSLQWTGDERTIMETISVIL